MKIFFVALVVVFFIPFFASAQDSEAITNICDASKNCQKACQLKAATDADEKSDSAYQQLLLKCAEDVAKNLQLIQ